MRKYLYQKRNSTKEKKINLKIKLKMKVDLIFEMIKALVENGQEQKV